RFFRNRVRHGLLPRLAEETGGDLVARLGRLARRAREAVDALDHVAAVELSRLAREEDGALVLSRSALAALPRPVAAEILRAAAASLGSRAPLRAWGHRGLRRVLADAPPRRPFRLSAVLVALSGHRVRLGGRRAPRRRGSGHGAHRSRGRAEAGSDGTTSPRGGRMRVSMKVMAALVVGLALVPSLPAQAQAPSPPRPSRPAPAKPDAPAPV